MYPSVYLWLTFTYRAELLGSMKLEPPKAKVERKHKMCASAQKLRASSETGNLLTGWIVILRIRNYNYGGRDNYVGLEWIGKGIGLFTFINSYIS